MQNSSLMTNIQNSFYIEQPLPEKGDVVAVGLSGGVDSSVTALLLKERGCIVKGVTMSLWDGRFAELESETSCYSPHEKENIEQSRKFCEENGIEYHVIDVKEEFQKFVLEYFKEEYREGRTPNPCIRCNRFVKFGALLEGLKKLDIQYDYFCTGHYAKIVRPEQGLFGTQEKPYMIAGASDSSKDQTYFLYRIPSEILSRVRFPLAKMQKKEVIEIARKLNLTSASRKESQDFIGEEYFDILFSDKKSIPGDIIDLDGKILGKHRGIEHYTIGQRRGLGVAVNYPVYVKEIDKKNNTIVLAPNDALNSDALIADDFVWPGDIEPQEAVEALVKIRLASRPAPAVIEKYTPHKDDIHSYNGSPWKITFKEPQRAVAPGQSAVLYKDNVILGGGIIVSAYTN